MEDDSYVTLQETDMPSAVAEIYFWNEDRHINHLQQFDLELGDIIVDCTLEVDFADLRPDLLSCESINPDYYVTPSEIIVDENSDGVIYVFPYELETM
jgi:hypothetical protein